MCTCLPDFIGNPPNCRAECVSNSECLNQLACINQKCKDPCVGSCGANANCHVVSHTPMCSCVTGYTGDPFTQCAFRQRKYPLGIKDHYNILYWRHLKSIAVFSFFFVTKTAYDSLMLIFNDVSDLYYWRVLYSLILLILSFSHASSRIRRSLFPLPLRLECRM